MIILACMYISLHAINSDSRNCRYFPTQFVDKIGAGFVIFPGEEILAHQPECVLNKCARKCDASGYFDIRIQAGKRTKLRQVYHAMYEGSA